MIRRRDGLKSKSNVEEVVRVFVEYLFLQDCNLFLQIGCAQEKVSVWVGGCCKKSLTPLKIFFFLSISRHGRMGVG